MFIRDWKLSCILIAFFLCYSLPTIKGIYDFQKESIALSNTEHDFLNSISDDEWIRSIRFGSESVEKRKRLEQILISSQITVRNRSLSHSQLLDTLPNKKAQLDNEIALKILKSSLHFYHTLCLDNGIKSNRCSKILRNKELPEKSNLAKKCRGSRDGHHAFRRLLPCYYKDNFYEMYSESEQKLPSPRDISRMSLSNNCTSVLLDDMDHNLALVSFSQFVEHDISKPVVTSMINGEPIECCNKDNYSLLPRHRHEACAPLLGRDARYSTSCLNYVRSALAVETCSFGGAQQVNQATGYLDLSQLYGFTKLAQSSMRAFKDGKIRSMNASKIREQLLPMTMTENTNKFCAFESITNHSFCFMAGDSRVNSNPFAITIYTIFLRNHNQIAETLKMKHTDWNDEKLYYTARAINVDIYRRIVFNDLLPELLGENIAKKINAEPFVLESNFKNIDYTISNEFSVAAIRFYLSMMPDALHALIPMNDNQEESFSDVHKNDVISHVNIFILREQQYTPRLMYTSKKLDEILESLLQHRAMKMDATYVSSLIPDAMGNVRPMHADVLAFDIQRGRDHGVQPYFRYLEICENVKMGNWKDLEQFIEKEKISILQSLYSNWTNIDLIVGGIFETPLNGTILGPTFTCILGEQFSKIRQWQNVISSSKVNEMELEPYKSISAADLLCANSDLKQVPKNIFRLPTESNRMESCAKKRETISLV